MVSVNKRVIIGTILILLMVLVSFVFTSGERSDKIDEEVIKRLSDGEKVKVVVQFEDDKSNLRVFSNEDDKVKGKWISGEMSEEEIRVLSSREDVKQIAYDYDIVPLMGDVVDLMNSSIVWERRVGGDNLTGNDQSICIIDTGANYNHVDLGGGIGEGYKVIAGHDFGNDDDDPMDYNGHGTHVAGIAAAEGKINGTARGANLVIMKVFTDAGGGDSSDMISAIEWCTNNASVYNISVISMSLGLSSGGVPILKDSYCDGEYVSLSNAINDATDNNISVVIAAGNEGNYTHIGMPACMENAMPVIWGTKNYSLYSSGNRNNMTQLFSPGTSVKSTNKDGSYEIRSGSSMSTPAVSGTIAILNQYLNFAGKTRDSNQIESLLNRTGVQILDSETGLTFSHVDIYSAIYGLDEEEPFVELGTPLNDASSINSTYEFSCNASDPFLKNVTFYLWNSSYEIVNKTSFNFSVRDFYKLEVNVSGIGYGEYSWNCEAYDSKGYNAYSTSNNTLIVQDITTELNSPSDDSYQSNSELNYSCSSNINSEYDLSNITFYLWNSTDLVYEEIKDISGDSNNTFFNYSTINFGNYEWNCFSEGNTSNGTFANGNYSFTFDDISPVVTLASPADGQSYTGDQTLLLEYSVSDGLNISNCSLYVDGVFSKSGSSIINQSQNQNFTKSFSEGSTYTWQVKCEDLAGNEGSSSSRTIEVNEVVEDSETSSTATTSGGGGASVSVGKLSTDSINVSDEKTALIGRGSKLTFNMLEKEHTIEVKQVTESLVSITISSDPIDLVLSKGETKKLSVDKEGYYDLSVEYVRKIGDYAKIVLIAINEPIQGYVFATGNTVEDIGRNETLEGEFENNITIKMRGREFFDYVSKKLENRQKTLIYTFVVVLAGIIGYVIHKKTDISFGKKGKDSDK